MLSGEITLENNHYYYMIIITPQKQNLRPDIITSFAKAFLYSTDRRLHANFRSHISKQEHLSTTQMCSQYIHLFSTRASEHEVEIYHEIL